MGETKDSRRLTVLLSVGLVVAVGLVYFQAVDFDFSGFDDDDYVTNNPHIQSGLTAQSVAWAFASTYASNWHPLTWMSHMLDWQLFEADPAGHHFTSVVLHAANAILLLLLLTRLTRRVWPSAFVAALFALHPLHVESVAWIAERKDVLSTLFCLLTMLAYVRYAEKPGVGRYGVVLVLYALGLMAKPMLVTVPVLLLLLDYWPLGRIRRSTLDSQTSASGPRHLSPFIRCLVEKIPLFVLAGASCVMTFIAQRSGGSVGTLESYSIGVRAANAAVVYVAYVLKTAWPSGLMAFYPHAGTGLPLWQVVGSVLLLFALTRHAIGAARTRPWIAVGWFWYVVTLVPVVGLVQVGQQGMADRYTYIPLIGIFVIIAWGGAELVSGLKTDYRARTAIAVTPALAVLAPLSVAAHSQAKHWQNDMTLWKHAIAVAPDNYVALFNLGCDHYFAGDIELAISYYRRALRANPSYGRPHYNLAVALEDLGQTDQAMLEYRAAIRWNPKDAPAHSNLGLILANRGKFREAERHYRAAIKADPSFEPARENRRRLREFLQHGQR
jgi:hypothetical protein